LRDELEGRAQQLARLKHLREQKMHHAKSKESGQRSGSQDASDSESDSDEGIFDWRAKVV